MTGRTAVPPAIVAAAAAAVAVVAVLGGIFVFAADEKEPGDGPVAGPAPTTRLTPPAPYSSGAAPDGSFRTVPDEQEDGDLRGVARTKGRNLYLPLWTECVTEQAWLVGEHADRVLVEIRPRPGPPPSGVTTAADGSYGCFSYGTDGVHAVIELAEPLGDRRLVVTYDYGTPPT